MSKKKVAKLKGMAPSLEKSANAAKDPADSKRIKGLAGVLERLSPA